MKNEKLKIEEIVGYLPFGLKILFVGNRMVDRLSRNDIVTLKEIQEGIICVNGYKTNNKSYLPILYPLSELNNQQLTLFSVNFRMWYNKENFDFNLMIYSDIELCHKLHIDYRNLIGRGLAIDINTLNK
jgi:hypothetical protein